MQRKLFWLSTFLALFFFARGQQESTLLKSDYELLAESVKDSLTEGFRISGYIQTQFQYGQKNASLKVGDKNKDLSRNFSRIGIRRGRLKMTFQKSVFNGVLQVNITENEIGLKDAYLSVKDPWTGLNAIRIGALNCPFGYSVSYSSSQRISPERARIIASLFPGERDLGVILSVQAPESSSWNYLKMELGFMGGNGINPDSDNKKDFISHLSFNKYLNNNTALDGGVSYYNGHVYQGSTSIFKMSGNSFIQDNNIKNKGAFAKRKYLGADMQLSAKTKLGEIYVWTEYIIGMQPGGKDYSESKHHSSLPDHDTYIRPFKGGYISFAQNINKTPLFVILKYDTYDPNRKVSGNEIGLNETGAADIAYDTIGIGLLWKIRDELRASAYYDRIRNEENSQFK